MKYTDIIQEEPVVSSWIADLSFEDDNVIMSLDSGRAYEIENVPEDVYTSWLDFGSKGQFWHGYIRGMYPVYRIQ